MKCNDLETLVSGYVDDQLSQEQKVCVEKAIDTSDDLRQELQDYQLIKQTCSELEENLPTNESWDKFDKELWEKIDNKTKEKSIFSQKIIFAAAVLLMAAIWLFLPGFNTSSDSISFDYTPISAPEKSDIKHTALKIQANIPKYQVPINIHLKEANLTKQEINFLHKEGFVVTKNRFRSFNEIYKENQRKSIPSYLTVDTAISGFSHILGRLRVDMEENALYDRLSSFTEILANKLIELHDKVPQNYKKASLRSLAFVRVASILLGLKYEWPQEIEALIKTKVQQELQLIYNKDQKEAVAIIKSPIFGYPMDYHRFRTLKKQQNDRLERYILTHEWFARCLFRTTDTHSKISAESLSETRSAMLILIATITSDGMFVWEEIHYILTALYGQADDPHLLDYLKTARNIYGATISLEDIAKEEKLVDFCKAISRVRLPKIRSELGLQSGLRIFSRRSIGCDFILQQLTYPYVGERNLPRIDPSLLDIAVIMGWYKAKYIAEEKGYYEYKGYGATVRKYQKRLKKELEPKNDPWTKGGLISLAWMFNALQMPEQKGSPMFSYSEAWQARKLTSVACGLLDLSAGNPIFTGKSHLSFYGTIDPYPEFFNRMSTKIKHFEEVLGRIGYPLNKGAAKELIRYRDMLKQLSQISSKMLANKKLTKENFAQLANFTLGWKGEYGGATVQDISTMYYRNSWNFDNHLYAGVGPVYELWVAVPINGKIQLARGGIFGYHEFQSMRKLSNEKWKKLSPKPGLASWIKEYVY